MLGGGTFTVQNKILPGTYVNFVSIARASNIFGDRGTCALALELPWGKEGIVTLDAGDLMKDSLELFGVPYTAPELKPIREALTHAKTVLVGRLNVEGAKATGALGTGTITARYAGTAGNRIAVKVANDVDNVGGYIVQTRMAGELVDEQHIKTAQEWKDNAYVTITGLELSAGEPIFLSGGTDGTVTVSNHTKFLEELESYYVNTVGYAGEDEGVKRLYAAYVKRLRDDEGIKLQAVLFDHAANHEGVINVTTEAMEEKGGYVYWVTGATAGANVNKSLDNIVCILR